MLTENSDDYETADERSSTIANATRRLGKLVCADELEFGREDAREIARQLVTGQEGRVAHALAKVMKTNNFERSLPMIVFSGHGEFLGRAALELNIGTTYQALSLTKELGPTVSRCATAHALAVLAREAMP